MKKHIKCNENVVVNGLAMDIYEMKKKYEVRFLFKKRDDIDNVVQNAMGYLWREGYFDNAPKKAIDIIGTEIAL